MRKAWLIFICALLDVSLAHAYYYQYLSSNVANGTQSIFAKRSLTSVSQPGSNFTALSGATCTPSGSSTQWTANHTTVQNALNGLAANGTLWVPAGCQVYLQAQNNGEIGLPVPGSTNTIACAGDSIAGFYNQTGYQYGPGTATMFAGHGTNGFTFNGCVLANTFNFSLYHANLAQVVASGGNSNHLFIQGGNDIIQFFGGDSDTVKNSLIQGNYAGEGVDFDGTTNYKFDNNVIFNNGLNNAFQLYANSTGEANNNWIQNSSFSIVTNSGTAPHATISNNTVTCTNTVASAAGILPTAAPCTGGYQAVYGCLMATGCDSGGSCDYSNVTIGNNTFAGAGIGIQWSNVWHLNDPHTNTFIDGAADSCSYGN